MLIRSRVQKQKQATRIACARTVRPLPDSKRNVMRGVAGGRGLRPQVGVIGVRGLSRSADGLRRDARGAEQADAPLVDQPTEVNLAPGAYCRQLVQSMSQALLGCPQERCEQAGVRARHR